MSELAILGGTPVRKKAFPAWPVCGRLDESCLIKVSNSENWKKGEANRLFENEFASFTDTVHCIPVANGTVSLELILRALEIGYGDEVILPPYTFIATLSSIVYTGAKPVFADIDRSTYNICPKDIEKRITKNTKAIVAVAVGGRPPELDALTDISKKYNISLIVDAAQGVGAAWRSKSIAKYGVAASFSCQNSKNLSSGEGGIITTDDSNLACKIRGMLTLNGNDTGLYLDSGLNEFAASLLSAQLKKLPGEIARRTENAEYLTRNLSGCDIVKALENDERITTDAKHLYLMRFNYKKYPDISRDIFLHALSAEGITASAGYKPIYTFDCTKSNQVSQITGGKLDLTPLPECEIASNKEGLWLYQALLLGEKKDMDDIISAIGKIERNIKELAAKKGGLK